MSLRRRPGDPRCRAPGPPPAPSRRGAAPGARALVGLLALALAPAGLRASCGTCDLPSGLTWAENLGFPSGEKILILHADDAGMFQGGNDATRDLLTNLIHSQYVQSASAMPPTRYYSDFFNWWQANPGVDVGVHLTLNSEWTKPNALRWGPVSPPNQVAALLRADQTFKEDHIGTWRANAPGQVETEIQGQHAAGVGSAAKPSHFDSHMGTVWVRGSYYRNYLRLGRANGIPSVTVRTRKRNIHFSGRSVLEPRGVLQRTVAYFLLRKVRRVQRRDENANGWPLPRLDYYCRIPTNPSYDATVDGFIEFVRDKLDPGVTQFFFHPNYDELELRQSTNDWERRTWDADLFTDPRIHAFFTAQGIRFTNWTDLGCRWECNPGNCASPWVKPTARCP